MRCLTVEPPNNDDKLAMLSEIAQQHGVEVDLERMRRELLPSTGPYMAMPPPQQPPQQQQQQMPPAMAPGMQLPPQASTPSFFPAPAVVHVQWALRNVARHCPNCSGESCCPAAALHGQRNML